MMNIEFGRKDEYHFCDKKFKKKNNVDKFKNKSAKHRKFKLQKMQEDELDEDIRNWEKYPNEEYQA